MVICSWWFSCFRFRFFVGGGGRAASNRSHLHFSSSDIGPSRPRVGLGQGLARALWWGLNHLGGCIMYEGTISQPLWWLPRGSTFLGGTMWDPSLVGSMDITYVLLLLDDRTLIHYTLTLYFMMDDSDSWTLSLYIMMHVRLITFMDHNLMSMFIFINLFHWYLEWYEN